MIFRSNLNCPDLTKAFPHAVPKSGFTSYDHTVLCDPKFWANCGYATHDEAAIIYNLSLWHPGKWLEIGSHTGWTAAHIAHGGSEVIALDPEYATNPAFKKRAEENLERAGVLSKVSLAPFTSEQYFALGQTLRFDAVFIDGNHSEPEPTNDAKNAVNRLHSDGIIVFHDHVGDPVRNAVQWLKTQGFKSHVYKTPQEIAVCYRGDLIPPLHVGDKNII